MTRATHEHRSVHAAHCAEGLPPPRVGGLRRGARQGLLAVLDQGVVGGTNFVTMIVVGRYAGASELGAFALGLTFVFLAIAAEESLLTVPYTIFVRKLSGRPKASYAGGTLAGCLAVAIGLAVVVVVAAWIAFAGGASLQVLQIGLALAPALVFWLLREAARRYAYADFRAGASLAASAAVAVVQLAFVGWLAWTDRLSAVSALWAVVLGNGAAAIGWLTVVGRRMLASTEGFKQTVVRNWNLGRWMFAGQAATTVGMYALPWIVAVHLGTAAAGAFAACASVMRLASPFLVALTNVVTPQAAQAFSEGGAAELSRVVRAATWLSCLLTGAFCLVVVVGGDWLLFQLFGMGYADYHWTLVLLAAALAAAQLSLAVGRGLLVMERSADCLKADLAQCLVSLAGAALLVQFWRLNGVAAGALAGGVAAAIVTGWYYLTAVRRTLADEASRAPAAVAEGRAVPLPLGNKPGEAV